jgi:hypothetical protein
MMGAVIPLFGIDPYERELRLQGTGTLVAVRGGDFFLFTAGHVIDSFPDKLPIVTWVGGAISPVMVDGPGFTSEPRRFGRSKDHIDLAFLRLNAQSVSGLTQAGAQFIDASWFSLDHDSSDVYAVLGYPLAINEPDFEQSEDHPKITVLNAEPRVIWATACDNTAYARVKRSPAHNVVVQRQPPRGRRPSEGMKNAQGMSGGPIFNFGPAADVRRSVATIRLAGILTEYNPKTKHFIGANSTVMSDIFRRGASS